MAKYAPSALIGRISRSAGSTTFGHNRFGAYFRNRVIPTNPVTVPQGLQRGNFGTLSSFYRQLSESQRQGWIALGANIIRTDSLGETYDLTGVQAYISVNRELYNYGAALVSDAPVWTPPNALASVAVTATA